MVSVVMPAHKFHPDVLESIESVLHQTDYLAELIVVDDSGNGEVAAKVSESISDDKLKFVINSRNLGSGPSRNAGVEAATSEFLAFCDSDDLWMPEKLKLQVDFMIKEKLTFSFTSYSAFDTSSGKTLYTVKCNKPLQLWDFLKNTLICTSTVILDRKRLGDIIYFPPIRTSQDTACWIGILKMGATAVPFNRVLSSYREGNTKATSNKKKAAFEYFQLIRTSVPLSFIPAAYCFVAYALNATLKRLRR
jgi:teichuronic acid biosynthesis glycosyltransferase TuaG